VILALKDTGSFCERVVLADECHCERPSLRWSNLLIIGEYLTWVYAKNIRNNVDGTIRFITRHPAVKFGA
jgi:hypothetical protein